MTKCDIEILEFRSLVGSFKPDTMKEFRSLVGSFKPDTIKGRTTKCDVEILELRSLSGSFKPDTINSPRLKGVEVSVLCWVFGRAKVS